MDIANGNTLGDGIHRKDRSRCWPGMTPANAIRHGTMIINLDVEGNFSSGVAYFLKFCSVAHGYPRTLLAA